MLLRAIPALAAAVMTAGAARDWLDVPFVRQVKAGCGAAAVAMVVEYWGREQPELSGAAKDAERIDRLLPASTKGIRGRDLKRFLEERGFDAYIFNGELSDLRHHFERGRPVVVCLGVNGPKGPLHYAVVVGVSSDAVWLNDSARTKLVREDPARFAAEWRVTDNWAMLAVPRRAQ